MLYPIAMGILSILLTWKFMLIVFGLSILPWFWLRPSSQRIRVLTVMVIGPALGGFWSQGLYYLPNPPIHFLYQFPWTISWLGSPGLTTYGLIFGLEQTARVLVTVSTSMLILVTTDVSDFTWAFERFRMPPQVGFALTAALRFLPEMISRTTLVLRAVELRGYDLSRPRWYQVTRWPDYVRRLSRCVVLITVPLLVGTLRGTTTMAMVADARGFGTVKRRGSCGCTRPPPWTSGVTRSSPRSWSARSCSTTSASAPATTDERQGIMKEARCASTQSCSTTAAP